MHMWHVLIPHAVDAAAAAIRKVCAAVRSGVMLRATELKHSDLSYDYLGTFRTGFAEI